MYHIYKEDIMINFIRPKKRMHHVNMYAIKQRREFLKVMSRSANSISIQFKCCGYGIELSGIHLILTILVSSIIAWNMIKNKISVFDANSILAYAGISILDGVLFLIIIKIILSLVSFIKDIPRVFFIPDNKWK